MKQERDVIDLLGKAREARIAAAGMRDPRCIDGMIRIAAIYEAAAGRLMTKGVCISQPASGRRPSE